MTRGELQSPARRNDRHSQLIASRKPSEMARTANFVPEYAGTIFLVLLMPSLNYESRCKAIPASV